tara:strand:+ start:460 stop:1212 length:753 start_codon:yes stop_codon:yes gene_type:complete
MANRRISSLSSLGGTPNTADIIPITDVSDTTGSAQGTTKKVTVANLVAAAPQGDLLASNNLSDVANAGTSRTNLGLGTSALVDTGTTASKIVQLDGSAKLPAVDGSQLTGISSAVTASDLRGTINPHIGAFPNQSFLVVDSQPPGSALMVADSVGLKFAVGASANVYVVKGASTSPSRLAEASELPSFIITKDSGEPDIELTDADGEVYSVVNGDSDTLGENGLPIRQGYQLPNIGANPSPLLISGGTIS